MLESIAPAKLRLDRFMPPSPLRVITDHRLNNLATEYPVGSLTARLRPLPARVLSTQLLRGMIPGILNRQREIAAAEGEKVKTACAAAMREELGRERERLIALRQVNDAIRPEEITAIEEQMVGLEKYITTAQLRLDAVRLIFCGKIILDKV